MLMSHIAMVSTTLYSSLLLPLPFSRQPQKSGFLRLRKVKAKRVFASGGGEPSRWDHAGKLVDESMIVLRKRVHEMKVIERNYEPPADWTEWEKQYYVCYDELVCNFVGLLQRQLMNTRPSLALGIVSLLMMSVPALVIIISLHLMEAAAGILSTTTAVVPLG